MFVVRDHAPMFVRHADAAVRAMIGCLEPGLVRVCFLTGFFVCIRLQLPRTHMHFFRAGDEPISIWFMAAIGKLAVEQRVPLVDGAMFGLSPFVWTGIVVVFTLGKEL